MSLSLTHLQPSGLAICTILTPYATFISILMLIWDSEGRQGLINFFFSSEPPTNIWSYDTTHDKPLSVLCLTIIFSLSHSLSPRDRFDMGLNYLKLTDANIYTYAEFQCLFVTLAKHHHLGFPFAALWSRTRVMFPKMIKRTSVCGFLGGV